MSINKVLTALLSVFCLLTVFQSARASDDDEQAAVKAALSWVSLVDQSKYPESWNQAASYFKSSVKKGQWESQVKAARLPMGKMISRTVKTKKYATTLPGAPDGQYVVIQFETKFANKEAAIETITPKKDNDGEWRVCGYFIR